MKFRIGSVALLWRPALTWPRGISYPSRRGRTIPEVRSDKKVIYKPTIKAFKVKKTGRIRLATEIIARVKKEMQEPRLTESVRNARHSKRSEEHTSELQS